MRFVPSKNCRLLGSVRVVIGAVFLLGNYLVSEPWIFAADMALIASGVPVYWIWLRGRNDG